MTVKLCVAYSMKNQNVNIVPFLFLTFEHNTDNAAFLLIIFRNGKIRKKSKLNYIWYFIYCNTIGLHVVFIYSVNFPVATKCSIKLWFPTDPVLSQTVVRTPSAFIQLGGMGCGGKEGVELFSELSSQAPALIVNKEPWSMFECTVFSCCVCYWYVQTL